MISRARSPVFFITLLICLAAVAASAEEQVKRTKVYAIAYQVGSLLELKELIEKEKWAVTMFPRWADKIIVALRTDEADPLYSHYGNWRELEEGARKNNNKNGKRHLIYFYNVDENDEITLEKFILYPSD